MHFLLKAATDEIFPVAAASAAASSLRRPKSLANNRLSGGTILGQCRQNSEFIKGHEAPVLQEAGVLFASSLSQAELPLYSVIRPISGKASKFLPKE